MFFYLWWWRVEWQRTSKTWLWCPRGHRQLWNWGHIASSPSLRASLSCLCAWQGLTLGCLHSLIMNTAVWFSHRPEVALHGRQAVSLAGVNSQISGLWRTVTWKAKFFFWVIQGLNSVELSRCQSRWGLATADYHPFTRLPLALKNYSESNSV